MIRAIPVENFNEWRTAARSLLAHQISPALVTFSPYSLPGPEPLPSPPNAVVSAPRGFLELAKFVAMHRDPERWNLLYRTLYRLVCLEERHLLQIDVDPDVRELNVLRKAVARDIHKMHAFVRFRKLAGSPHDQYIAWHRPDHFIVEHVGPWFARRFGSMHWAILTPDRSVYWDTETLRYGPGVPRSAAPQGDELEDLWLTYYQNIFNPARLNIAAMTKEMPVRHWATMPEAALIPALTLTAPDRETAMQKAQPPSADPYLPSERTLPALAQALQECHGCDLYRHATQAVFGEGPKHARVLFVGEQPGDQEDLQGKPFVGPAGQLWDKALAEAGIDRSTAYVTNAVKHFKFEERGKRRIHKKPRGPEVAACRPWLTAEIEAVNPEVIVALGATAALSVGGREFAIQRERGQFLPLPGGRKLLVTVHPSFLLRVPEEQKASEFALFVRDLRLIHQS